MHMDMSQEAFCAGIYKENAVRVSRDQCFVRACAVEMHMDMSQESVRGEIYRENAGRFRYHLDWTPALTVTVRTPQCATLFGKKNHSCQFQKILTYFNHVFWKTKSGNRAEKSRKIQVACPLAMTGLNVTHVPESWSQAVVCRFRCSMPLAIQVPLDLSISLAHKKSEKSADQLP